MARLVANFFQDLDEKVARTLDWSDDLNASTISTVVWTVPVGLTSESETNTTTTTTIRLAATATGTYVVTCTVVLINPVALEEKMRFAIREGGKTVGAGVVVKITE